MSLTKEKHQCNTDLNIITMTHNLLELWVLYSNDRRIGPARITQNEYKYNKSTIRKA